MIPGTSVLRQVPAWQSQLARAITGPAELLAAAGLGEEWLPAAQAAARLFPLRVPRGFVARMRKGDPHDPLLRQVLPLAEECLTAEGFGADPVGDLAAMTVPGVLHKYQARVLLTVTGACAVHCRYCFRRHFPYADANPAVDRWQAALEYIAHDHSLKEVILSGGDPLTLSDRRLAELARQLETIPHLRRLRLHTRLPVVLPERVNDELLGWLGDTKLKPVIVVHANHAQELDDAARQALAALKNAGAELLNQSVLLRGVNDSVEALADLSEALFETGTLPYYLHMLDKVQGAAHFDVDEIAARRLMQELQARLPGYLVPRLVREVPGGPGKLALT
ncbi:lysine 2,3-aminomutase [Sulfuricaulis limicola]|uniref:L-lysine 2,3-aminomutase n=1 Tax=Sulfuricaulis limicola TaxID=1620215 RepID=A0A1B4XIH9_9GAMM|nr:EF-P beta-lysylation protein EpmB [Sulfuricaulis limicola]BAV34614.1 lysine 2,3-aminomutase [Sulfuricaulis limicola]